MLMRANKVLVIVMSCLLAVGFLRFGYGVYIPMKAAVAQKMMQRAWRLSLRTTLEAPLKVKPWPWADTWPIARLHTPDDKTDLIVLAGGSGRTLAFAPGHVTASAMPGEVGNIVIAGHRDTHFQFLADVQTGDRLVLERADAQRFVYEITALDVVDSRSARIVLDTAEPRLTLVTCYPFDTQAAGGPLRYVVTAVPISAFELAAQESSVLVRSATY